MPTTSEMQEVAAAGHGQPSGPLAQIEDSTVQKTGTAPPEWDITFQNEAASLNQNEELR